jgi:hypothetical protein
MIADVYRISSVPIPIPYMKIDQHIVSGVPVTPPPEGIRDPRIHVSIIGRRSIVGDHRRALIIVIIIYNRSSRIIRCRSGTALRDICSSFYGQIISRGNVLNCFQRRILSHGYFSRICRFADGCLQFSDNIRCNGIICDPPIPG